MDLGKLVALVLGLAVSTERLLEVIWTVVEGQPAIARQKQTDAARYAQVKSAVSVVLAIVVGEVLSYLFVPSVDTVLGSDAGGTVALGFLAGILAPYSHQLIEMLYQTQKLLQTQQTALQTPQSQISAREETIQSSGQPAVTKTTVEATTRTPSGDANPNG
jgi:hypothetical protein